MYDLRPEAVCVLEGIMDDPRCAARVERMLAAIGLGASDVRTVTLDDVPVMVRERGWTRARVRPGEHAEHTELALAFTR